MWTEKFLNIADQYKNSIKIDITDEEKTMGDTKYSIMSAYKDKIKFNYFLKGDDMTYMQQIFINNPSYSKTLTMEITDSKVMNESDLDKLPEGLEWEDMDDLPVE